MESRVAAADRTETFQRHSDSGADAQRDKREQIEIGGQLGAGRQELRRSQPIDAARRPDAVDEPRSRTGAAGRAATPRGLDSPARWGAVPPSARSIAHWPPRIRADSHAPRSSYRLLRRRPSFRYLRPSGEAPPALVARRHARSQPAPAFRRSSRMETIDTRLPPLPSPSASGRLRWPSDSHLRGHPDAILNRDGPEPGLGVAEAQPQSSADQCRHLLDWFGLSHGDSVASVFAMPVLDLETGAERSSVVATSPTARPRQRPRSACARDAAARHRRIRHAAPDARSRRRDRTDAREEIDDIRSSPIQSPGRQRPYAALPCH